MKVLKSFLKITATIIGLSFLSSINSSLASDLYFRPTKLEAKFYELGFRNSTTGELAAVFSDSSGTSINIATEDDINTLSSGLTLNNSGTFDQLYFIISNTVSVEGEPVSGCYIKSTDVSYNDGDFRIGTNNSALAGTANITETGFGMNEYDKDDSDSYTTIPAVTTSINGTATSNLILYLVNKDTKTPGLGGTINAYLFVGDLETSINLDSSKSGTLWIDVDASQAMELDNGNNGDCDNMSWQNTKFGLSVEQ